MRSVSYRLVDLNRVTINLGFQGENEHTTVIFDCKKAFDEYPDAVCSLSVVSPHGEKYPAIITRNGDYVEWVVTDSDLAYHGDGQLQLTFMQGNVKKKTYKPKTHIDESIIENGNPPSGVENWLDTANQTLAELPTTAKQYALSALDEMTVEAETLPEGSSPEVVKTVDPDTGAINLDFKIPAGGGGTSDYEDLENKPTLGGVTLDGEVSLQDIGAYEKPSSGIPAEDIAEGVIPDVTGKANLTVIAPVFNQAMANDAGSFVTYTDGVVYLLPDGHTAGATWANTSKTATNIGAQVSRALNHIEGVSDDVDDLLEHETYEATSGEVVEYIPITVSDSANEARTKINAYGTAIISVPASSTVKIYPVEVGKTYKVKGRCINTTERPLLIVADSVITSSTIATTGNYDYVLGSSSTATEEEIEYTALRTGYMYITSTTSDCGVWWKKVTHPTVTKYHIDDVVEDLPYIKSSIESIDSAVFKKKIDSASANVKNVPRNADHVAKVTNIVNTVTLVRSIISRNLINKNDVGDVEVDASGTLKVGMKTVHVPPGNYYCILGNVGNYTMVKRVENGIYTTLYKEQFPMKLSITDPAGGYFIVYASSLANLGDISGVMIGRLGDYENTLSFEPYAEKTYSPEVLTEDNRIEVRPYGFIEFVNASNADVASTVEYTLIGKDDDTTTRKDFIVSPDGSKFLPMVKDDGTIVTARVVPKKALFIGNSLTSGWQTFGEAATDSDHDFVAFFSSVVEDMESNYTFSRKWSTGFEQQTSLADAQSWVTSNIDPLLSSDLDLIVVQLCENVVDNASAVATFPESSLWLMQHLRDECPKARVVWMGLWFERRWVATLLENTAKAGVEYIDIRPLYTPENVSVIGTVYKMDEDYTKSYDVDSFVVSNGTIALTFTVDDVQYTATIPSYTSYTSSGDTQISVTGVYQVVSTYYASIHPGDEGFRKIANKMLFDLGISDSEETIPADA